MKEETKQLLSVKGEVRIAEYLTKLIEEGRTELEEKIIASKKNLDDCWKYITYKAKKQAINGCACIEDETVYGWAEKFYNENGEPDDMEKPVKPAKVMETAKKSKAKENSVEEVKIEVAKPVEEKQETIPLDFTEPAKVPAVGTNGEDCMCAICGKKLREAYPDKSLETIRKWAQAWSKDYGAVFCSKEHKELYLASKEAK